MAGEKRKVVFDEKDKGFRCPSCGGILNEHMFRAYAKTDEWSFSQRIYAPLKCPACSCGLEWDDAMGEASNCNTIIQIGEPMYAKTLMGQTGSCTLTGRKERLSQRRHGRSSIPCGKQPTLNRHPSTFQVSSKSVPSVFQLKRRGRGCLCSQKAIRFWE